MIDPTINILRDLVAFETNSGQSNLDMVAYVQKYLSSHGVDSCLSHDETGQRANLHAFIGPEIDGGIVLNGHTDIVPVAGQKWSSDPFELRQDNGRLYGRGAVDMKGFLACMLAMVPQWQQKSLLLPIHISMCYDEEIGGFGAPVLVADMLNAGPRPAVAIVGEPTEMQIVAGHKGGYELHTTIKGLEAHSSDPRKGVSAISYAVKFIQFLEELGEKLAQNPHENSPYDPAYTTFNVGTINGGAACNIVAGNCDFVWEIRPTPHDNGAAILAEILGYAEKTLLPEMQKTAPDAMIETEISADVPALNQDSAIDAIRLLQDITGLNSTKVVSFATDAGHFCNADISTAVFGPGSIEQAHKPDEFIEISELERCLAFLDQLGDRLS